MLPFYCQEKKELYFMSNAFQLKKKKKGKGRAHVFCWVFVSKYIVPLWLLKQLRLKEPGRTPNAIGTNSLVHFNF